MFTKRQTPDANAKQTLIRLGYIQVKPRAPIVLHCMGRGEWWGQEIESPSGSNVRDGIGVTKPFPKKYCISFL